MRGSAIVELRKLCLARFRGAGKTIGGTGLAAKAPLKPGVTALASRRFSRRGIGVRIHNRTPLPC
jgi:hypothetical protein